MDLEKMRRLTQKMENVNDGTKSTNAESAVQLYDAGIENQKAGHHRVAFDFFKKSAEAGNSFAMKKLGDIYYEGNGVNVNKNIHEAFIWYKRAAELGNVDAMWRVADAYNCGHGIEQDETQAFAWIKKLAEIGDEDAMGWLGAFYRDGYGVVQNNSEAFRWTQKAANQGVISAMYNLAFMYIDRFGGTWRGIKENVDDAIYWMTKVAESGTDEMNVNAMFILGHLYEDKFKTINYDERGNIRPFDDVFAEGGFKCKEMTKKWFQKADNL